MTINGKKIGVAITGSFCTFSRVFAELEHLVDEGADVTCIFSQHAQQLDTRFGNSGDFIARSASITGHTPLLTIPQVEPVGPKHYFDLLLIAPCTGNTMAKLANGIIDTPVLMATKSHLRNARPVVLSISSNDCLSLNLKNIGLLANFKNMYFVPFGQDNCTGKPYSMIAHTDLILPTIEAALDGVQLQPVIQSPHTPSCC